MAGGVIFAAWVQAVPIWATALTAAVGLSTWRTQLRGQRQLKHAEKALASGREAFLLARSIRGRFSTYAPDEMADASKRQAAYQDMISQRLERAWTAWRKFAEHYLLVRLFFKLDASHVDLANELADCLADLSTNAEMMFLYSRYTQDDKTDRGLREQLVGFRKAFYGAPQDDFVDTIGARLSQAEKDLDAELRPILAPPTLWDKIIQKALREPRYWGRPHAPT